MLKKNIKGHFDIEIIRVGKDGLPLDQTPSSSKPSSSTGTKRKGPDPLPYSEKRDRSQRRYVAALAKKLDGIDPNALYRVASSQIGKVDKNMEYVMGQMKDNPRAALEISNMIRKKQDKNKGI